MRCAQEMCGNWSGDGQVCPCDLFDIDPDDRPVEGYDPCSYCPHDRTEHAEDGCRRCPCAVPQ